MPFRANARLSRARCTCERGLLAQRLSPPPALSRSYQVHWKVRLTRSFPSLFSRAFAPTCLVARHRSAYRALSLFDASMHAHTHLEIDLSPPPPPMPRLPSCPPLVVSLNSEETLGCSRGLFGTERSRVTDFDRDTRHGPDFNVITPSALDRVRRVS